jgi:hypothetical protein
VPGIPTALELSLGNLFCLELRILRDLVDGRNGDLPDPRPIRRLSRACEAYAAVAKDLQLSRLEAPAIEFAPKSTGSLSKSCSQRTRM